MQIKEIDNIDYEKATKILYDSYIPQWLVAGSPEWSSKYTEYLDKTYMKPRGGPCVGAFEGDNLVGIGFGYINDWKVMEIGKIPTMAICYVGVLPKYQRKGIAISIVKKLEEIAGSKQMGLLYRICNDELSDWKLLAKCGFTEKIDDVYQMARILGSDMVNKAATFKEYGAIMKQLVKTVAGLPKEKPAIEKGIIRDGVAIDAGACIKILDSYKDSTQILREWTEDEFKKMVINTNLLTGTPFVPFFRVWEVDRTIKAFVIGRIEFIHWKAGLCPSGVITDTGFASDLDRKDKTNFILSIIFEIKEKAPEAFATNIAVAHHEEKTYDKAGFNNDRSKRPLYVKAVGGEFKKWLESQWKYKTYYISYQR
jgi:GNAT superfamily N-acetyltransferase